jgi:L-threonylcarbamoyladenylate synthase
MELVSAFEEGAWGRAAEVLAAGGVVALPTDTIYGVAASVTCPAAVVRLFALKARDTAKPVAVLVADAEQAAVVADVPPAALALAARFWPGALTLVLPRRADFTVDLGGSGATVGVRSPAHEELIELCRRLGPLATTSANRSGRPTPVDGMGVSLELAGTGVDLVLDGGRSPREIASTVVRVDEDGLTVLRAGPIALGDLHAAVASDAP